MHTHDPKIDEFLAEFYNPTEIIGTMNQAGKVQVFGWAHDDAMRLVALSAQGGSTAVRAIHAIISMGNKRVSLNIRDSSYRRHDVSVNMKFRTFINPIPDTNYISMIMLAETLFGVVQNAGVLHIPYTGDEQDFVLRLHSRVRQLCHIAVLPEWKEYLWEFGRRYNMISEISQGSGSGDWFSARGFRIYQMNGDRSRWERLIQNGLRDGEIHIAEE